MNIISSVKKTTTMLVDLRMNIYLLPRNETFNSAGVAAGCRLSTEIYLLLGWRLLFRFFSFQIILLLRSKYGTRGYYLL
jgi:hypothetical protein